MRYLIPVVLLMIVLLTAGCFSEINPPTTPTQIQTPTVIKTIATIPQITETPTLSQTYKIADLAMTINTNPTYGFKMEYPSEWTYKREHTRSWKAGYNFSSPDGKSHAYVYLDDASGSAYMWYPLTKWANNTIKSYTEPYCLDGAAKRLEWDYCTQPNIKLYYPVLKSNDLTSIPGSFESRKLVFTSYDDRYYGQYTLYLMHAGRMQGYNYTVPDHPEVAVTVNGPVWDYGVGGQAYAIEFYSPTDQMNYSSSIFNHMINTFEITTKL